MSKKTRGRPIRQNWVGGIPQTPKRRPDIYNPNLWGVATKIIGDAIVWDKSDPRHPEHVPVKPDNK